MSEQSSEPDPADKFGGLNPGELFARVLPTHSPSGGDGRTWVPPTLEELQRALPQYEIIEMLGRGGMGVVYKGVQRSLDRFVAIKILPPGIEDADIHYAERFKLEAKAMAHLSHPGIVAVHDAGETADGLFYFVMDFIEGTDVEKMIAQGPLPSDQALAITAHVCDALGFAHESGIIHRDIKPANIMVDTHGRVRVADFGLAKATLQDSGGFTGTNLAMGTPAYMAPEAITSIAKVDGRADLYAVGVMLYAMLTGEIPRGRFALPSTRLAGLDPRFDAIVDKAMQTDREQRYASAAALRADIDRMLAEPVPVDAPLPGGKQRPLLLAVIIIALAGSAAWWFVHEKKNGASVAKPVAGSTSLTPASPHPATVSPSDRIAALAANPANWTDRLNTRKWEGVWVMENGVLKTTDKDKALSSSLTILQDGAIRVRARAARKTGLQLQLGLRTGAVRGKQGTSGSYKFQVNGNWSSGTLVYLERPEGIKESETSEVLWDALLPAAVAGQSEIEWEFRAVGDEFSVWANGTRVASAHHTAVPMGAASFVSDVGLEITKVETISFGGGIALAPPPPVASSPVDRAAALAANPANWVDCLNTRQWPNPWVLEKGVLKTADKAKALSGSIATLRDGAIRIRARATSSTPTQLQLLLRNGVVSGPEKTLGYYQLFIGHLTKCSLNFVTRSNGVEKSEPLWTQVPVPTSALGNAEMEWELRVVGDEFSAWANGQLVASAHHAGVLTGNASFVSDVDLEITKVETIDFLSAAAPAPPPSVTKSSSDRVAALAANPANWTDRLTTGKWEAPWALEAGVLKTATKDKAISRTLATLQDGALRVKARATRSTDLVYQMSLRSGIVPGTTNTTGRYQLVTTGDWKACSINYVERRDGVERSEPLVRLVALPGVLAGQRELAWEFRAVGDELSVWVNGQLVTSTHDTRVPSGRVSFTGDVGMEITAVETIDFDSAAAPVGRETGLRTTFATATKDAPFVNTLGMKFVPVPITGGPTGGQRVLFSVWETRVQDYAVFVTETKRVWDQSGNARASTHPAGSVKWEGARAFCAWLTERDQKAGRLDANARYRLPSDHEWSCAVGIGPREDPAKTPLQKSRGIANVFPWGSTWPPPPGAGNYRGEEAAGLGPVTLTGYRDDFPSTAPVGSFAANALGLFDLGGNGREWCEDISGGEDQRNVLRGAAFSSTDRDALLSSDRFSFPRGGSDPFCSLRAVLAADKVP